MSMVTRCPTCATVFRVTPQQLQARQGQVRCGRCMTVFNGFGTLATLPEQQPAEELAIALPQTAADEGASPSAANATAATSPAPPGPPATECAQATEAVPAGAGHPAATAVDPVVAGGTAVLTTVVDHPLERVETGAPGERVPETGRPRGSRSWAAAAALMLAILAAQAGYAYRGELVARYPGLKPVFTRLCDIADCTVALPQRPQLVIIEASDLQVEDQLRPGVIQLTATLRNHAGHAVGYPALDLVLTNTKQHALARRIFPPSEYLEKRDSVAEGLPAHAEVTVRLLLDTGDLGAAGFRLALLPARS
jgi:predicted Zn finger-like uncharacterized protein